MADEKAGHLAGLISRLWWHGQRTETSRSARDTAQAAPQETPHPLAADLQQLWQEQIGRMDRRLLGASEDAAMPLSPLEAANRINEQVTVEMLVKAAKNCPLCSQIFLDSEEDHHDPKNLAVAVTKTGKARFKDVRIDDPTLHFKGQVIRVTGVVTLKENRPQIEVDDPRQIEVVENNK
jgi:hypothetical protein